MLRGTSDTRKCTWKDRILHVRDSRSKSKSPGSLGYARRKHRFNTAKGREIRVWVQYAILKGTVKNV